MYKWCRCKEKLWYSCTYCFRGRWCYLRENLTVTYLPFLSLTDTKLPKHYFHAQVVLFPHRRFHIVFGFVSLYTIFLKKKKKTLINYASLNASKKRMENLKRQISLHNMVSLPFQLLQGDISVITSQEPILIWLCFGSAGICLQVWRVTNPLRLERLSNEQDLVNWISISHLDDSSSSVEWEEVLSIAPALNIFVVVSFSVLHYFKISSKIVMNAKITRINCA